MKQQSKLYSFHPLDLIVGFSIGFFLSFFGIFNGNGILIYGLTYTIIVFIILDPRLFMFI